MNVVLSVIIVNWNRRECLSSLLVDIQKQTFRDFEIVIVDNGSNDGAYNVSSELGIPAKMVRLHKNFGLSAGRNIGLVNSSGSIIFMPDNDLRLPDPDLFSNAVTYLTTNPVAVVSCSQFGDAEALSESRGSSRYPVEYWFFTGGACFFRRDVFEKVGLFDDDFSYGGEEWDLSFRIHAAQLSMMKNPALAVVHKQDPGSRVPSHTFMILLNMMFAQLRYMPATDALALLVSQISIVLVRSVRSLNPGAFFKFLIMMVARFRRMVLVKRKRVSRTTMNRWYRLRLLDKGYALKEPRVSVWTYYLHKVLMKKDALRRAEVSK